MNMPIWIDMSSDFNELMTFRNYCKRQRIDYGYNYEHHRANGEYFLPAVTQSLGR